MPSDKIILNNQILYFYPLNGVISKQSFSKFIFNFFSLQIHPCNIIDTSPMDNILLAMNISVWSQCPRKKKALQKDKLKHIKFKLEAFQY